MCRLCGSKDVSVRFPTVCIATHTVIKCNDCVWEDGGADKPVPATNVPLFANQTPLKVRSTDYAVNNLFVLCHLASGDGGREAGRLLGFLGLPKSTSMSQRAFTDIESRLGPVIRAVTEEIITNNLIKECKGVMEDEGTYEEASFTKWKDAVKAGHGDFTDAPDVSPGINVG